MFKLSQFLPTRFIERFGRIQKAFTDEEIDRILFFEKILKFSDLSKLENQIRLVKTASFIIDDNTNWLWQKISEYISRANYDLFFYNIDHLESIEFIIYESGNKNGDPQCYWHSDQQPQGYYPIDRKISGTLMLSESEDYEGGDLEIDIYKTMNPSKIHLDKGDIVFFDSTASHRVTPVTSGTRKVLAFWARGKCQE